MTEGCVNGESAGLSAWCTLPNGAKAVSSCYVYPLEELGITQPEQLQELTFALEVWESSTYEAVIPLQKLTLPDPDRLFSGNMS